MIPLNPGETILAVRRKSWFVFATTGMTSALMMLVPILALTVLAAPKLGLLFGPRIPLFVLIASFFEWTVWMWLFTALINYYFDIFIVTNERIIQIDQKGLFNRTTSELRLSNVQDVQVEHRGFSQTLFKFGSIKVQSAGEQEDFFFNQMDKPEELREIIMANHREAIPREYAGVVPPAGSPQNPPLPKNPLGPAA